METRNIEPHIVQTMWDRKTGYQYVYHAKNAPWIHRRHASDLPIPKHYHDIIAKEQSKYEPYQVSDGETVLTITPKIEQFNMQRYNGVQSYHFYVFWYNEKEEVVQTNYYAHMADDELVSIHHTHLEDIAKQIKITLKDEDHKGVPHNPGTGPLTSEPVHISLRLEYKDI